MSSAKVSSLYPAYVAVDAGLSYLIRNHAVMEQLAIVLAIGCRLLNQQEAILNSISSVNWTPSPAGLVYNLRATAKVINRVE